MTGALVSRARAPAGSFGVVRHQKKSVEKYRVFRAKRRDIFAL
jgi:hypothetical protein